MTKFPESNSNGRNEANFSKAYPARSGAAGPRESGRPVPTNFRRRRLMPCTPRITHARDRGTALNDEPVTVQLSEAVAFFPAWSTACSCYCRGCCRQHQTYRRRAHGRGQLPAAGQAGSFAPCSLPVLSSTAGGFPLRTCRLLPLPVAAARVEVAGNRAGTWKGTTSCLSIEAALLPPRTPQC